MGVCGRSSLDDVAVEEEREGSALDGVGYSWKLVGV